MLKRLLFVLGIIACQTIIPWTLGWIAQTLVLHQYSEYWQANTIIAQWACGLILTGTIALLTFGFILAVEYILTG